jgi:putative sigma-54 modulation protein
MISFIIYWINVSGLVILPMRPVRMRFPMKIDIRGLGFTLTEALREHADRRLRFALARRAETLEGVLVRLSDENGPRGGVDKACRVELRVKGQPPLVVEAKDADLYAAVDRAAGRAARALGHELGRSRERILPLTAESF